LASTTTTTTDGWTLTLSANSERQTRSPPLRRWGYRPLTRPGRSGDPRAGVRRNISQKAFATCWCHQHLSRLRRSFHVVFALFRVVKFGVSAGQLDFFAAGSIPGSSTSWDQARTKVLAW